MSDFDELTQNKNLGPIDAFWHFANLFLPAWAVAALMAGGLKLLWRKDLKTLSWRRLALWGGIGGCLGILAALALTAHDGKMLGYGLMIIGISLPQWWLTIRR